MNPSSDAFMQWFFFSSKSFSRHFHDTHNVFFTSFEFELLVNIHYSSPVQVNDRDELKLSQKFSITTFSLSIKKFLKLSSLIHIFFLLNVLISSTVKCFTELWIWIKCTTDFLIKYHLFWLLANQILVNHRHHKYYFSSSFFTLFFIKREEAFLPFSATLEIV